MVVNIANNPNFPKPMHYSLINAPFFLLGSVIATTILVCDRLMRRGDRLFEIIQVIRRASGPLTAAAIAAELETSRRTIYREIGSLIAQRVPIRGNAGIGYLLKRGFDMAAAYAHIQRDRGGQALWKIVNAHISHGQIVYLK